MKLVPKNQLLKQAIMINPVLQRVVWGSEWGMGNQASLPKQLRYRKYFNISDFPSETKVANINQQPVVSNQVKATKMSKKATVVSNRPYQNAFNMSKMISLGMPRSYGSQNDPIGIILR